MLVGCEMYKNGLNFNKAKFEGNTMLNSVDGQETQVIMKDPQKSFEAAIAKGYLSREPSSDHYAGHYMYMCHDRFNRAYFKHRITRETLRPVHLPV